MFANGQQDDEPSIVEIRFNRVSIAEDVAKAIVIFDYLHSLEILGNVEFKTRKDKKGTSETIIEAFYKDLTETQFYAIIEAYPSAINFDNAKIIVEVAEDKGDSDDTKVVDEDYTIFHADGTKDAYPRRYLGCY